MKRREWERRSKADRKRIHKYIWDQAFNFIASTALLLLLFNTLWQGSQFNILTYVAVLFVHLMHHFYSFRLFAYYFAIKYLAYLYDRPSGLTHIGLFCILPRTMHNLQWTLKIHIRSIFKWWSYREKKILKFISSGKK